MPYIALIVPYTGKILTFGNKPIDRSDIDQWFCALHVYLPQPHKAITDEANVNSFKFYTRHTGKIFLQIWRSTTTNMIYEMVSSEEVSKYGLNEHIHITAAWRKVIFLP